VSEEQCTKEQAFLFELHLHFCHRRPFPKLQEYIMATASSSLAPATVAHLLSRYIYIEGCTWQTILKRVSMEFTDESLDHVKWLLGFGVCPNAGSIFSSSCGSEVQTAVKFILDYAKRCTVPNLHAEKLLGCLSAAGGKESLEERCLV
jgi:hypothetical protein